jgi:TRAP-type C4-dicarboxylate transport system permease small subunit
MLNRLESLLAMLFGMMFLALSVLIAVEVLMRKLFDFSLEGSYELGGYALAVGATLSFTLGLFGRNHIRIDILHGRLPQALQGILNGLAAVLMAGLAGLLGYLAWGVIGETMDYHSRAQTPWATPLIYPQSVWYVGQVIFMLVAAGLALRAVYLLLRGRLEQLNEEFQPKSVKQELADEVESASTRQRGAST